MIRVKTAEALGGNRVRFVFTNGDVREIDLTPFLNGPVFERIRTEDSAFRELRVDEELGTIVWPNGADIDPDVLYHGRKPAAWARTTAG